MLATCAVVGYATLMPATSVYNAIVNGVSAMNINPYVMVVVGTAIYLRHRRRSHERHQHVSGARWACAPCRRAPTPAWSPSDPGQPPLTFDSMAHSWQPQLPPMGLLGPYPQAVV
jgi:hypothetical protein